MPRFFRRLAEGVFDLEDLAHRTAELAHFTEAAAHHYGFHADQLVALGFSNGANIAASLLLSFPATLAAAVLIRPMLPFVPERATNLHGKRILLLSGRMDPIVPAAQPQQLTGIFQSAGAQVTLHWERAGHALTENDVVLAKDWLAALPRENTSQAKLHITG